MKKLWIGLLVIAVVILSFIFIYYLGFPIGQECGYWNSFGDKQKECECIGIKTGHCSPGAVCDGGSYGCIGICQNCVCRQDFPTEIRKIVSCD